MADEQSRDPFDARLHEMQLQGGQAEEVDIAVKAFERLATAMAIGQTLLSQPSTSDVLAIFAELSADSRARLR